MLHHLPSYLKEAKTVILPDLGAITVTNADTGESMFMSFLKHDDGKFAEYVAQQEGMDFETAKEKLKAVIQEVQTQLNSVGNFTIPGFGRFFLESGEIDFASELGTENAPPAEEPAASIEPVAVEETPIPEPEVTPEPEVIPEPVSEPEPEQITPPVEEPTPHVDENPIVEEPTAIVAPIEEENTSSQDLPETEIPTASISEASSATEEVAPATEPPLETPTPEIVEEEKPKEAPIIPLHAEKKEEESPELNILQKEQLAASQKKLEDLRKAKETKPARKKRGAGFWMLIVLIALLCVGGTFVGVYYDDVKQHIPFLADEKAEEEKPDLAELEDQLDPEAETETEMNETESEAEGENVETAEAETPVEAEPAPQTPPPAVSSDAPGGMTWHLIAGTFSLETNAQRLAANLKKEGFNPAIRQVGAMYLVSVKGFPTKEAALAGKSEVNAVAPKAWLYEWK